jgi:hypothetical protein
VPQAIRTGHVIFSASSLQRARRTSSLGAARPSVANATARTGASVENAEGLVFIAKTSTPRLLVVSA